MDGEIVIRPTGCVGLVAGRWRRSRHCGIDDCCKRCSVDRSTRDGVGDGADLIQNTFLLRIKSAQRRGGVADAAGRRPSRTCLCKPPAYRTARGFSDSSVAAAALA